MSRISMRSISDPPPTAFSYAFIGQLPPEQEAALCAVGKSIWDALALADRGPAVFDTKREVASALADLLVAARHLAHFDELFEDSEPPEDALLLKMAAACGKVTLAAAQPLQAELTPSPEERLRAEMAEGAVQLQGWVERLRSADQALDRTDRDQAVLSRLVAVLVMQMQRLAPAIDELLADSTEPRRVGEASLGASAERSLADLLGER